MDIKPIETEYNGYMFRSRLEARWAVFFDSMGIKYEYEPEGFTLSDGTNYLPDFRIYVRHRSYENEYEPVYVEVKGELTKDAIHKAELFCGLFERQGEFVRNGYPLIILGNIPKDEDEWLEQFFDNFSMINSFLYMDSDSYCAFFTKHDGEIWLAGPDHEQYHYGDMNESLLKARKARFEFGETPN